jgi:hypothetical protein
VPATLEVASIRAQTPNRLKTDRRVAADRALVRDGRVDRGPVMAPGHEVLDRETQRTAAEPTAVKRGGDGDIESHARVPLVALLDVLDPTRDLAAHFHYPALSRS